MITGMGTTRGSEPDPGAKFRSAKSDGLEGQHRHQGRGADLRCGLFEGPGCGQTGLMLMQKYSRSLINQSTKLGAAVQHSFPEAAVHHRQIGQIPIRPFAALVTDVSVADKTAISREHYNGRFCETWVSKSVCGSGLQSCGVFCPKEFRASYTKVSVVD